MLLTCKLKYVDVLARGKIIPKTHWSPSIYLYGSFSWTLDSRSLLVSEWVLVRGTLVLLANAPKLKSICCWLL
ncbi:hypothetical protein M8J77_013455 [Diaphorina citri]|nr:hypothetical protein M8J77_013455 [Diaphorina citri]